MNTYNFALYQYFKIAVYSPEKSSMLLAWYALGEADTANRPYKLRLASKYDKYTLERARIGRYADENGLLSA